MSGAALRRPPLPPLLARARDRLRALPAANPRWGSDALLIAAEAFAEAALQFEVQRHVPAADGCTALAEELRKLEARARGLAPVFAPPREESA